SRRRHTKSKRDWSSDVCSSDLITVHCLFLVAGRITGRRTIAALNIMLVTVEAFRGAVSASTCNVAGMKTARKMTRCTSALAYLRSEERRVGRERQGQWPARDRY